MVTKANVFLVVITIYTKEKKTNDAAWGNDIVSIVKYICSAWIHTGILRIVDVIVSSTFNTTLIHNIWFITMHICDLPICCMASFVYLHGLSRPITGRTRKENRQQCTTISAKWRKTRVNTKQKYRREIETREEKEKKRKKEKSLQKFTFVRFVSRVSEWASEQRMRKKWSKYLCKCEQRVLLHDIALNIVFNAWQANQAHTATLFNLRSAIAVHRTQKARERVCVCMFLSCYNKCRKKKKSVTLVNV